MSARGDLLTAFKTKLNALLMSDGTTKAFTKVLISVDDVTPQTFYSLPVCVIGSKQSSWDDENPELGTFDVWLDMWTRDMATTGGKAQLTNSGPATGERGINELEERIVEDLSHFSNAPFFSACSLVGATEPERLSPDGKKFLYHKRITYQAVIG